MELGTTFAMNWLSDVALLRELARELDDGGIDFVSHGGHLLTARADRYPERPLPTYALPYRDPFVLYSHLAAITERLRFRPAVLILPMLPTVLVAKQAADLSILSGGRFDLGVGLSWQEAEFGALGTKVGNRGKRMDEQIDVLRRLWTEPFVTYEGRYHHIDDLGIGQLPTPIVPIWIATRTDDERALRRVGRLADGWTTLFPPSDELIAQVRGYAAEAGRPADLQINASLTLGDDADVWTAEAVRLRDAGVTSLSLGPGAGLSPADSVAAVLAARGILADALA